MLRGHRSRCLKTSEYAEVDADSFFAHCGEHTLRRTHEQIMPKKPIQLSTNDASKSELSFPKNLVNIEGRP